jgi:hypothetical protein
MNQIFNFQQTAWDNYFNNNLSSMFANMNPGMFTPAAPVYDQIPMTPFNALYNKAPVDAKTPFDVKTPQANPVDTVATAPPAGTGGIGDIIADLMLSPESGGGAGGICNKKFVEVLAGKGIQAREVNEGEKKAFEILDGSGNVVAKMIDNNGDGSIGMEDSSAVQALHDLGVSTDKLQSILAERIGHREGRGQNNDHVRRNFEKITGEAALS